METGPSSLTNGQPQVHIHGSAVLKMDLPDPSFQTAAAPTCDVLTATLERPGARTIQLSHS